MRRNPGNGPFHRLPVKCRLNGKPWEGSAPAGWTLLEWLRTELRLTGAKEGCAEGECGACTVLFNGRPANACLIMAVQANGAEIFTVEGLSARAADLGLADSGDLHPIQEAFVECGSVQCGFCIPGMLMSAAALVEKEPAAARARAAEALSGNLCRCTGYEKIFRAVETAGGRIRRARRPAASSRV